MTQERQEVLINTEGIAPTTYDRIVVRDGEHQGEIVDVSLQEMKKYNKPNETEKKFIVKVQVEDEKVVPLFCSPVVSKGSKGYNNSKLFDLLTEAKLLDELEQKKAELSKYNAMEGFLLSRLVGRTGRFGTKTVNKGQETEYSVVKEIYEISDETKTNKPVSEAKTIVPEQLT